jgi:PAS domain S-box-containing protein
MGSRASNSDQGSVVEALLEGMGESFFALDRDRRVTAFNSATESVFGVTRAEVIDRLLWDVAPQTQGTESHRRCRRVMRERTREEFESYSALGFDRYHELRAFLSAMALGRRFEMLRIARGTRRRCVIGNWSLPGSSVLAASAAWKWIWPMAFRSQRSPEYLPLHGLPADFVNDTQEQWIARIHPEDRERVETYFWPPRGL